MIFGDAPRRGSVSPTRRWAEGSHRIAMRVWWRSPDRPREKPVSAVGPGNPGSGNGQALPTLRPSQPRLLTSCGLSRAAMRIEGVASPGGTKPGVPNPDRRRARSDVQDPTPCGSVLGLGDHGVEAEWAYVVGREPDRSRSHDSRATEHPDGRPRVQPDPRSNGAQRMASHAGSNPGPGHLEGREGTLADKGSDSLVAMDV